MISTIFVQIASYRDPELLPTIKDCLKKAKYPERLTFGICRQYSNDDKWDDISEYENNPQFKFINIIWNESKGACWARSKVQQLWDGEDYTLQLDSHHRFIEEWDEKMLEMMKLTGSPKPLITAYAGVYNSNNNKLQNVDPYKMVVKDKKIANDGNIYFIPETIPNWEKLDKPIHARFVSGHYYFTYGIHCRECKYDPNLYFNGEELTLSIRSYTAGYDLFHPHKLLIWHEYTRNGRTKHWDDFNHNNKLTNIVEKRWDEINFVSMERLRHFLGEENNNIDLGEFGIGNVRTMHDYEVYAGINFKLRLLHPNTIKGIDPPVNDPEFDWIHNCEKTYEVNVSIPKYDNIKFIYIGIHDNNNVELTRNDINEYKSEVIIRFKSFVEPVTYTTWVCYNDGVWGEKIVRNIN
jgi:hypothetical protein